MLGKEGIKKELNRGIYVDDAKNKLGENYILVTLGDSLKVYDESISILDVKKENKTKTLHIPEEGLMIEANRLYLGRTNEYTKTKGYVPLLAGLDELAALGIEIHITAGFGDNGFEGTWTLEIVCANPTIVYPGMPIGQIYYYPLIGNASIEYRGKYFRQIDPTSSRLYREYENTEKEKVKKYVNN